MRAYTFSSTSSRPGWRRWFAVLFTLVLLLAAPALSHAQGAGADSVTLSWTAPGDDSVTGTAAAYDLRMSTSPIDDASWDSATPVTGLPAPQPPGTTEYAVVRGLTQGTTYWFAIKTSDHAGNWSALSNVFQWTWTLDTAPPTVPSGLQAARGGGGVQLQWSPDSDPDLLGYSVYRATDAAGPFTRLTGTPVTVLTWLDASTPAGASAVWYALTASDVNGNESGRTAAVQVSLIDHVAAIALQPVRPNPSRAANAVFIPLVVPPGATQARISIVDATGRRVRTLDATGLTEGAGEVLWDGRSDAGRIAPPGVYRAFVAGNPRGNVRVVRLP